MTEKNTYQWKLFTSSGYKISDNQFLNISTADINIDFFLPFTEDTSIATSFLNNYSSFTIEKKSRLLIKDLIVHYNLPIEINNLCALSAIIQKDYIYYFENPLDSNYDDLIFEYRNFKTLFDLIEKHLKNEPIKGFKNVQFNSDEKYTFKSAFIYKELLSSLVSYYELDLENFSKKKEEVLSLKSKLIFDKIDEYHKIKHINDLKKIITSKKKSTNITNEDIRFVACFLLLSQIPINKRAKEFSIPINSTDVASSDINNLRKYIDDEKKIFY